MKGKSDKNYKLKEEIVYHNRAMKEILSVMEEKKDISIDELGELQKHGLINEAYKQIKKHGSASVFYYDDNIRCVAHVMNLGLDSESIQYYRDVNLDDDTLFDACVQRAIIFGMEVNIEAKVEVIQLNEE